MPDYIIRQRDRGQAEAKASRPRPQGFNAKCHQTWPPLSVWGGKLHLHSSLLVVCGGGPLLHSR